MPGREPRRWVGECRASSRARLAQRHVLVCRPRAQNAPRPRLSGVLSLTFSIFLSPLDHLHPRTDRQALTLALCVFKGRSPSLGPSCLAAALFVCVRVHQTPRKSCLYLWLTASYLLLTLTHSWLLFPCLPEPGSVPGHL